MTVAELIKVLQTKNPEALVWFWYTGGTEEVEHVIGDGMPSGEAASKLPPVLLLGGENARD